jgi:hypothetical protein
MDLPLPFKTFRITRIHMMRELEGLGDQDLLTIPDGRDDNILWNVGHLLCSLSRLTYVFSGYPLPIPEHYLGLFGKGTNARDWPMNPPVTEVLKRFEAMPEQIESDYRAGKFTEYQSLQITPTYPIDSVEEAIAFHCFHEGLHLGKILTLKESLGLATAEK